MFVNDINTKGKCFIHRRCQYLFDGIILICLFKSFLSSDLIFLKDWHCQCERCIYVSSQQRWLVERHDINTIWREWFLRWGNENETSVWKNYLYWFPEKHKYKVRCKCNISRKMCYIINLVEYFLSFLNRRYWISKFTWTSLTLALSQS